MRASFLQNLEKKTGHLLLTEGRTFGNVTQPFIRLSGGEGLVIGQGRRGITLLHARLNQGGGVLYRWGCTLLVMVSKAKRAVGTNYEEVK